MLASSTFPMVSSVVMVGSMVVTSIVGTEVGSNVKLGWGVAVGCSDGAIEGSADAVGLETGTLVGNVKSSWRRTRRCASCSTATVLSPCPYGSSKCDMW